MATNNAPSFRLPYEDKIAKLSAEHQVLFRSVFSALTDIYQALPQLKTQIDSKQTASTTTSTSTSSGSSTASTSVTPAQAQVIATAAIQTTFGATDNQTGTSYTSQNSDYGGIVTIDNAAAVAVTLGGDGTGIGAQWWCFFENIGAGTATITPSSGTINGGADITLVTNQGAVVFFDGVNWAALTSIAGSGGTITDVVAGTGLTGGGSSGSVTLALATPVSVADGGTGTASPGLVAGSGINVTGSWPDQTIAATGTAYIKGTVTVTSSNGHASGTFTGSGTVTGATTSMAAIASAPALISLCTTNQVTWVADVVSANTVEVQVSLPAIGPTWGNISFLIVCFP
jgi:hypothetical protein